MSNKGEEGKEMSATRQDEVCGSEDGEGRAGSEGKERKVTLKELIAMTAMS